MNVLLTDYPWPDVEIERAILGEVDATLIVAPRQDEATLASLAVDADAILTCWANVTSRVLKSAPRCQIVSRMGIGLDNIDVAWCTAHDIPVTNVPDYCLTEVAEHTIALILSLARKVAFYHLETKMGRYRLQDGRPLRRLEGQTLGIVGLGNIGQCVARKAAALGMRVVATSRRPNDSPGIESVSLHELLTRSDYVSLHLPLTPETRHFFGAEQFSQMKHSACLINTARGGLVDHSALSAALAAGRIAGAALDVQDPEPPDLSQLPYADPRVVVTPHAAFVSEESLVTLRRRATRQVATRLTGGIPDNIVNPVRLAR